VLERLIASAGTWQGTSTLQDPGNIEPETTASLLTVTPLLDGRFVRLDYTWSYRGTSHAGSLLVGCQKKAYAVSMHWIDSWHNSDTVMALAGRAESPSLLAARGSYAAPPGPDWGWKIGVTPETEGALRIVMHNISPEGQEFLAVEGEYSRG
jgi:hypothetical protein